MVFLGSCQITSRSLTTRLFSQRSMPVVTFNRSLRSSCHLSTRSNENNDESTTLIRNKGDSNDPVWEKMNEKTRSLARLLLDHDNKDPKWQQGGEVDVEEEVQQQQQQQQQEEETRASHIFQRRRALSQAITLIESQKPEHQQQSNLLLTCLLGDKDNRLRKANSFRLGIAGPPGAGE